MSAPTLDRQVFTLSRALEFFTERELTTQIGYDRAWWPIALVKELIDKALAELPADEIQPPPGLAEVIQRRIAGTALPWDQALFELVRQPPTDGDFRVTF